MSINSLRQLHPRLFYKNYHYSLEQNCLKIRFNFLIEPSIEFSPQLMIDGDKPEFLEKIPRERLEYLIFHLGLAELPSYWKAVCSPQIIVEAGPLNSAQLAWWHDLFILGMGEFYYTNQIDFTQENFLNISAVSQETPVLPALTADHYRHPYLIPVGGGKDSALTLSLLEEAGVKHSCLVLEPASPAALAISEAVSGRRIIRIKRKLDPKLLELNQQGYLNGHTPFSAYLSFLTILTAQVFGFQQILTANERSANQANLTYLDLEVNHQYSKSFDYEQRFRTYAQRFLGSQDKQAEYLSFLRPLYELQIAKLFSQYDRYLSLFKSCNVNQQQNSWCQRCAKCLFIYILLYPFVEYDTLTHDIFSRDLFQDEKLVEMALNLSSPDRNKPLECVGTFQEVQAAFQLAVKKLEHNRQSLPVVLEQVKSQVLDQHQPIKLAVLADKLQSSWNDEHNLNPELEALLKAKI